MVRRAGLLPVPNGADCCLRNMEVVIYHSQGGNGLVKLAKFFAAVGIGLILWSYIPSVWYWAKNGLKTSIANFQLSKNEIESLTTYQSPVINYQPPLDPTLPLEPHLRIVSIGVDTSLQEAAYTDFEEALKRGVWRVSDFGTPSDEGKPTILAAHRFGYLVWSNMFRRKNSFYNLPKLAVGDTVEIAWRQRKYVYEVYAGAKGDSITDYSADLILYTCETLNGPERIFKYARLLEV